MKKSIFLFVGLLFFTAAAYACDKCKIAENNPDFNIKGASVSLNKKYAQMEFEILVEGQAGKTLPKPAGQLDGAPVLAYVFPTKIGRASCRERV